MSDTESAILIVGGRRVRPVSISLYSTAEALADIICRASDEAAAALFVLMGTLENSRDPKLLANTAKHFAFIRCGESNLFGMVDAQLAAIETELLRANELIS